MLNFRNIPIKSKLMFMMLATSALVLLLAAGAFVTSDLLTFRRNMAADLVMLSELVGNNSSAGLVFNDTKATEENIAALKVNPHILVAYIFDKQGYLFASYLKENAALQDLLPADGSLREYFKRNRPDASDHPLQAQKNQYFFSQNHVEVFSRVDFKDKQVGALYIRSDMDAFNERLWHAAIIVVTVLLATLLLAFVLASQLQRLITRPIYSLLNVMKIVSTQQNYSIREVKRGNDEVGRLIEGFNEMLGQIEMRDRELADANSEITELNKMLKAENSRMGAELEITRQLQQMVLPKPQELRDIDGLDISGFMEPADEVGGDYYDVLHHAGCVKIGIGDVTGHGLESGVVMLMVQMAVRTLLINGVKDCQQFMNVLNRAVFDNVRRMDSDKNLTLALLDYSNGKIRLTGQHEEVLVIRKGGQVERMDTSDLGFMVGIEPDISSLINEAEITLEEGDGVVLYTDGITEARDSRRKQYGVERLCEIVGQHWAESAEGIRKAVVADVKRHIGENAKLHDDITILVIKQKAFLPLPEALSKGADQPFVSPSP